MMVPCACCGVVCEPEPYLYINFATHRGPLCPACFQAWSDPQRTCGLAELPIYRPLEGVHDPRRWWSDPAHEGY